MTAPSWLELPDTVDARIAAAQRRCECTGGCGRPHRKRPDGRCHVETTTTHPLVLAPAQAGTPWAEAARLAPAELTVWCPGCLAAAERSHRRAAADQHATSQSVLDLT